MGKDFSGVPFREFYDDRRNSSFQARLDAKLGTVRDGFKLTGSSDGLDHYDYLGDTFSVPDGSPINKVYAFAVWRDRVLDDGGDPDALSEYETPTADGWE